MKHVTTVVVGAGQSGLAMSRALTRRSVDHLVLERGRIGNSWRTERWDSLRLLTPNWMNGPAGHPYSGSDPDGFMSCADFASSLTRAALLDGAPVQQETRVLSLTAASGGYRLDTDAGTIACDSVVIATGEAARPRIPAFADALPWDLRRLTPLTYRNPSDVPDGGVLVVGASASGLQIARELAAAGRRVTAAPRAQAPSTQATPPAGRRWAGTASRPRPCPIRSSSRNIGPASRRSSGRRSRSRWTRRSSSASTSARARASTWCRAATGGVSSRSSVGPGTASSCPRVPAPASASST